MRFLRTNREPSLSYIFVPYICYSLAIFISFPIIAQVMIKLVCLKASEGIDCNNARVSSEASMVHLYTSLIGHIPGVFLSGFYGSIADKYGRKVSMVIPLIGSLFHLLVYCYIAIFKPIYFIPLAIFGSFISGLSGSFGTFLMAIFSYISDVTSVNPGSRSHSFSLIESCFYGAKIAGPLAGGIWAKKFGYITPLVFSLVLKVISLTVIIFIPESLQASVDTQKTISFDILNTFRNINLFFTIRPARGSSPLPFLIIAFFLYFTASSGDSSIFVVFVKHVFHWESDQIGYFIASEGCIQMFSILALPYIIERMLRITCIDDILWIQVAYMSK